MGSLAFTLQCFVITAAWPGQLWSGLEHPLCISQLSAIAETCAVHNQAGRICGKLIDHLTTAVMHWHDKSLADEGLVLQFDAVLDAYKASSRQWSSTLNRFAEGEMNAAPANCDCLAGPLIQ